MRALSRGLEVLAAINRGLLTAPEIAASVKLDRATAHRLLETMVKRGYLGFSPSEGTYRPTSRVLGLSDGFRDESWITDVAVPALRDLLDEVKWPSGGPRPPRTAPWSRANRPIGSAVYRFIGRLRGAGSP